MKRRTQIIKEFLKSNALPDMAALYSEDLECHVEVEQGDGIRDTTVKSPVYHSSDDQNDTWYSFRIDSETRAKKSVGYDFAKHVKSIGLSGWDYKSKQSRWVGFDFDSIVGHKKGLTDEELLEIIERLKSISWVTIRKSTSGKGLHVYVPLTCAFKVETRTSHIAIARGTLSQICGITGFNFEIKSDTTGSILWCYHRNTGKDGFVHVKSGEGTLEAREDWLETKKTKVRQEASQNIRLEGLSEEHRRLIQWFAKQGDLWYWDNELHMLVCHTYTLKKAHTELQLRGVYNTISTGSELPGDQNAFAFPIKGGSWIIRRHSKGVREHNYWKQDKSGWTYCLFNRVPTLGDISHYVGGQESSRGDYCFTGAGDVTKLLSVLSPGVELQCPEWANARQFRVKKLKDSKISITFDSTANDHTPMGWIRSRNGRLFERVVNILEEETELKTPDELIRHCVTNDKDAGWFVQSGRSSSAYSPWIEEPLTHISPALLSLGYKSDEIRELIGQCILNPWTLTNRPFETEYPGNREWNKFAAQLSTEPHEGLWPTWRLVYDHWGKNLTSSCLINPWCVVNNIKTGAEYLMLWTASVFQYPTEPLPYVFFFGPEKAGKSLFHEALSLLTTRGIVRAGLALTNRDGFNGELAGAILCINDDIDLSRTRIAHDRMKEWVTGKTITIRALYSNAYDLPNTTHWIQCANYANWCPIKLGDTRIVITNIEKPTNEIPKETLLERLRSEISAFLYHLTTLQIPETTERLRIPILETEDKIQEIELNPVEQFIKERLHPRQGHYVLFRDFVTHFLHYTEQRGGKPFEWTDTKIKNSIPNAEGMPVKGRLSQNNQVAYGNFSLDEKAEDHQYILELRGGFWRKKQ